MKINLLKLKSEKTFFFLFYRTVFILIQNRIIMLHSIRFNYVLNTFNSTRKLSKFPPKHFIFFDSTPPSYLRDHWVAFDVFVNEFKINKKLQNVIGKWSTSHLECFNFQVNRFHQHSHQTDIQNSFSYAKISHEKNMSATQRKTLDKNCSSSYWAVPCCCCGPLRFEGLMSLKLKLEAKNPKGKALQDWKQE